MCKAIVVALAIGLGFAVYRFRTFVVAAIKKAYAAVKASYAGHKYS